MRRERRCLYTPMVKSEEGIPTSVAEDYWRNGIFEFWGNSSILLRDIDGNPIVMPVVVGVIRDEENGNVNVVTPENIKFKDND